MFYEDPVKKGVRALVIGDSVVDIWKHVLETTDTKASIASEKAVLGLELDRDKPTVVCPGGAANVRASLSNLGFQADLLTICEDDLHLGSSIKGRVSVNEEITATRTRYVSKTGTTVCRVDSNPIAGACLCELSSDQMRKAEISRVCGLVREPRYRAVVISDYNLGMMLGRECWWSIVEAALDLGVPIFSTIRDVVRWPDRGSGLADVTTVLNWREASKIVGFPEGLSAAGACAVKLLRCLGGSRVFVTDSAADSVGAAQRGETNIIEKYRPVETKNLVGCGDAFLAYLVSCAVTRGPSGSILEWIRSTCDEMTSLLKRKAGQPAYTLQAQWTNGKSLETLRILKPQAFVLANGVFDCLHSGHLDFLNEAAAKAKETGLSLVVGVNSDASVMRIKGRKPLQTASIRADVLRSLRCVDACLCLPEEEDSAAAWIERMHPKIYFAGSEYQGRETPERVVCDRLGIRVVYARPKAIDWSTTKMLENYFGKES